MGNDLAVRLRRKAVPRCLELGAKLLVVLDDSIVDESNAIVGVRVGIRLAGCPMRRPAGVADADDSPQWLPVEQFLEASDLAHRLLGRLIGAAFALPLLWFWLRNRIPAGYGWRLTALLALGGLQGAIGWWMVTSGLSVRTDVSHIRLAVHLVTALVILSGIVWTALDLKALHASPLARPARLRPKIGRANV